MRVIEPMMAHEALKRMMFRGPFPAITPDRMAIVYDIIKEAELDDGFANEIDHAFSSAFEDGTAQGYSDLVRVFDDMPKDVYRALKKKRIL